MTKVAYYVECGDCGMRQVAKMSREQPWIVRNQQFRFDVPVGPLAPLMGECAVCGSAGKLTVIKVKARFGKSAPGCDGRCLNGKTSCDCQCNGRCHGAGECRCAA